VTSATALIIGSPSVTRAGEQRELWPSRATGWVSERELAQLNRISGQLASHSATRRQPHAHEARELVLRARRRCLRGPSAAAERRFVIVRPDANSARRIELRAIRGPMRRHANASIWHAIGLALSLRTAAAAPRQGTPPAPEVGKPAPDFTLTDLDGKTVKLSSFKGKQNRPRVVQSRCPFVKRSHSVGSLVDTAKRHVKNGVVWLAINSAAPGKQGNDPKTTRSRSRRGRSRTRSCATRPAPSATPTAPPTRRTSSSSTRPARWS